MRAIRSPMARLSTTKALVGVATVLAAFTATLATAARGTLTLSAHFLDMSSLATITAFDVAQSVMTDFGQTDFGQTDFGQLFLLPSLAKPTLARVSVLVVWPTLAKTDFGQTDFGQNRLWAKPTLGKTDFGQTDFGPNPTLAKPTLAKTSLICCVLCLCCVVCCLCGVGTVSRCQNGVSCEGLGFKVWFGPPFPWTALPLDRPSPGPPFPWTAQNFAFFPLPPQNSFFSSLSGCLLVEFWLCF